MELSFAGLSTSLDITVVCFLIELRQQYYCLSGFFHLKAFMRQIFVDFFTHIMHPIGMAVYFCTHGAHMKVEQDRTAIM